MLRQMTLNQTDKAMPGWDNGPKPQPMYVQVSAEGSPEPVQRLRSCLPNTLGTTMRICLMRCDCCAGVRVCASLSGKSGSALAATLFSSLVLIWYLTGRLRSVSLRPGSPACTVTRGIPGYYIPVYCSIRARRMLMVEEELLLSWCIGTRSATLRLQRLLAGLTCA